MKTIKYIILTLALLLITPFTVFAEGEETTQATDNRVKVYFFRGEGCPHCADAENFFSSIQEEYGSKFTIVDYETWQDEDNASLMKEVAKVRGEEDKATGVPYIIVGDKSWVGFADSMGDEIKSQIDSEFAKEVNDRYDVMSLLTGDEKKTSTGHDVVVLILILFVVTGICFGVYKARETVN